MKTIRLIALYLTKKITNLFVKAQKPPKNAILSNIYPNIHKLPLLTFIDTLLDSNYERVGGQLEWERLYTEYTELIGGSELQGKLRTVKETIITQSRMQRAKGILELLTIRPCKELYEQLYTFDYLLPELTEKNVDKVLKIFVAHYKRELIDLHEQAIAIEKTTDNAVLDYQYFVTIIVDMSTAFKMSINISEISVGQYCIFVQRYKQHCEQILKQQKNDI